MLKIIYIQHNDWLYLNDKTCFGNVVPKPISWIKTSEMIQLSCSINSSFWDCVADVVLAENELINSSQFDAWTAVTLNKTDT